MLDGEGPECGVGDVRPVNGRMQHHGPCDGHDGANVAFGDSIVMVSADASESNDLLKLGEVARELGRSKRFRIVGEIFLWRHACVATHSLEALFCFEGLVRVQTDLVLDKNVAGGMINEDATASVHVVELGFSSGGK